MVIHNMIMEKVFRGTRMRIPNNHKSARTESRTLPFAGLGFDMKRARTAAQVMTIFHYSYSVEVDVILPLAGYSVRPSGYDLLVALGREIRGR